MVQIFPFRGLRYNLKSGENLGDVTAPPYDVISTEMQDSFYRQHPANVIRLILGQKNPGDTDTDNVYTRAAGFFQAWQKQGILEPDEKPSMYAYSQSWTDDGGTAHERKGIIALIKVEEYETRQVLPHERTIKKYITDRFELAKATGANLSQIFMIYSDPSRLVEQQVFGDHTSTGSDPWQETTDQDGVRHRVKAFTDPALIQRIQNQFSDESVLIADGHHRYQTALTIKAEARKQYQERFGTEAPDGSLLTDYMMVFLSNMDDPGLLVYPTHRVLTSWPDGWDQQRFESELLKVFDQVDESSFESDPATLIYEGPGRNTRWTLKLKDNSPLSGLSPLMHDLDAAILDHVIFQGFFDDTATQMKEAQRLWFYRNTYTVHQKMGSNDAVAAFYLHAPSVHQVKSICESGELMPQKSTYFYPKILSGTVFHSYVDFFSREGHPLSGIVDEAKSIPTDLFVRTNTAVT